MNFNLIVAVLASQALAALTLPLLPGEGEEEELPPRRCRGNVIGGGGSGRLGGDACQ